MMRLSRVVMIVCAVGAALAYTRMTAQQPQSKQAAPPVRSVGADPKATESVVAVVNDEKITDTELNAAVNGQLRGRQAPPERVQELRGLVLQLLVDRRLIGQFLAEKKIAADPNEVDSIITDIKKQVADAGRSFEDVLKMQGQTEDSLRKRIAADLAFRKYAETGVTDAAAQEYFKAHQQELDGTEVQASHLLIKVEKDASEKDKQAAQDKVKAIRQEIEKGLDFAAAAKKYSACPSSSEGGDLGFFPRHGKMVEPFAATAFALKDGELSHPVETQFGWHLIKVTGRKTGEKDFGQVQDEVKEVLAGQLWDKTVAQQRQGAKIEIRN
ncbi:MAG: peptidylprolyl isomerase [Pirellulales bacterium]|nr:peptidylprolyl isomerase [Pirellulales bacterium]